MLNGVYDEQQRIMGLYAVADETPIKLLTSKVAVRLFQEVNQFRNRWTGHGGAVNDAEAARRLLEIEQTACKVSIKCRD